MSGRGSELNGSEKEYISINSVHIIQAFISGYHTRHMWKCLQIGDKLKEKTKFLSHIHLSYSCRTLLECWNNRYSVI